MVQADVQIRLQDQICRDHWRSGDKIRAKGSLRTPASLSDRPKHYRYLVKAITTRETQGTTITAGVVLASTLVFPNRLLAQQHIVGLIIDCQAIISTIVLVLLVTKVSRTTTSKIVARQFRTFKCARKNWIKLAAVRTLLISSKWLAQQVYNEIGTLTAKVN